MAVDIQGILEQAGSELIKEEARLVEEVEKRQAHVKEAEQELKQVRDALGRLGVKPGKKKARKQSKPAPTRADAVAALEHVLKDGSVRHMVVINEAVSEYLVKQGKSKMGLKLRIKEALKDERFIEDEGGYRLAEVVGAGVRRTAK